MIVLDTHVLVFDALDPKRLSRAARAAIERGSAAGTLACSDISLWEIALLVARGRVSANTDAVQLLDDIVQARSGYCPFHRALPCSRDLLQNDARGKLDAASRCHLDALRNEGRVIAEGDEHSDVDHRACRTGVKCQPDGSWFSVKPFGR